MINPQLVEYVKQQLTLGVSKDIIKSNLQTDGGWSESDIDLAFNAVEGNVPAASNIPQAPQTEVKYAGFWIRWAAVFIDGIVINILSAAFFGLIVLLTPATLEDIILSASFSIIIGWIYYSYLTYKYRATLGKLAVGIMVLSEDGKPLSLGQIVLRETAGKSLSGIILSIGYIMAAFTSKKQALHDKIAHTVVVYKDPSKKNTAVVVVILIAAFLFTLVVLAIFSGVVLASLNAAREQGSDAAIRSTLLQAAVQAELYSSEKNTYSTALNCGQEMFAEPKFQELLSKIITHNVKCLAQGKSFAISADLSRGKTFCVDNVGTAENKNATKSENIAMCAGKDGQAPTARLQHNGGSYSYTLPSGWKKVSNLDGTEAAHETEEFYFMLQTDKLAPNIKNDAKVSSFMSISDASNSIKAGFPSSTIHEIGYSMINGKEVLFLKFSTVDAEKVYLERYITLHQGTAYVLVFVAPENMRGKARIDFKAIVDTFVF